MDNYLLPTDDSFVEDVAKAIARDRLSRDASDAIEKSFKENNIKVHLDIDNAIDVIFEALWNGNTENDKQQRQNYKMDALAAIRSINLKLLIS